VSPEVQFLEEFRIGDEERDVGLVDLGDEPQKQEGRRDEEPATALSQLPVAAFATSAAMIAPSPKAKTLKAPGDTGWKARATG
jgi:hypothetical protein